ncbi:MAG TPA: DUF3106 domain-containing protein [Candidatus Acidoferrales bacterium]|nr:DUF3106 domain-containing protein [Candidatus Acidoferrales bacterium]
MTDREIHVLLRFLKFVMLALLAAGLVAPLASAQNDERAWQAGRPAGAKAAVNGKGPPNVRAMEGLPPVWIQRLRQMPADQQERFLENNAKFRQLPPERQAQIRQNLDRWNKLSPEQKQDAINREQVLERMTPEQRQYVRSTLLPKWQAMPPDRRQVINRHLAMLRNMSPATQQAALNDPRFVQGLSPDEQSMLRDLNSLRNPPLAQPSPP